MSDEAWRRHLLATEVAADWLSAKPGVVRIEREGVAIVARLHPVDPPPTAAEAEACPTGADGQRPDERNRGPPGDRG